MPDPPSRRNHGVAAPPRRPTPTSGRGRGRDAPDGRLGARVPERAVLERLGCERAPLVVEPALLDVDDGLAEQVVGRRDDPLVVHRDGLAVRHDAQRHARRARQRDLDLERHAERRVGRHAVLPVRLVVRHHLVAEREPQIRQRRGSGRRGGDHATRPASAQSGVVVIGVCVVQTVARLTAAVPSPVWCQRA